MSPLRHITNPRGALVMGILNRTPDSFSDGGRWMDDDAARARVRAMLAEGADVIDVGAESTRPGSRAVAADEQIARLGSIVRDSVALGAVVSVDTTLPDVAAWALSEGATIVNSVSLEPAAELARVAARTGAALVLMHSRGSMTEMRGFSVYDEDAYDDVVVDVARELAEAAAVAEAAGLDRGAIAVDPGLGFAKSARHSAALCARLGEISALGYPLVVGPSNKSFLVAGLSAGSQPAPADRLGGTIAATLACVDRGARMVRVHDVAAVVQALHVRALLALASFRAAAERRPEVSGV
jgi:dihydropteroate synthase